MVVVVVVVAVVGVVAVVAVVAAVAAWIAGGMLYDYQTNPAGCSANVDVSCVTVTKLERLVPLRFASDRLIRAMGWTFHVLQLSSMNAIIPSCFPSQ